MQGHATASAFRVPKFAALISNASVKAHTNEYRRSFLIIIDSSSTLIFFPSLLTCADVNYSCNRTFSNMDNLDKEPMCTPPIFGVLPERPLPNINGNDIRLYITKFCL
jgi:hypothetical protein